VRYPIAWSIRIPSEQTELRVTARLPDQEMNLTLRYWEGAVTVKGTHHGDPIAGSGYVELTGY
jgi:predicted secreted hydrolase